MGFKRYIKGSLSGMSNNFDFPTVTIFISSTARAGVLVIGGKAMTIYDINREGSAFLFYDKDNNMVGIEVVVRDTPGTLRLIKTGNERTKNTRITIGGFCKINNLKIENIIGTYRLESDDTSGLLVFNLSEPLL